MRVRTRGDYLSKFGFSLTFIRLGNINHSLQTYPRIGMPGHSDAAAECYDVLRFPIPRKVHSGIVKGSLRALSSEIVRQSPR
jgi:hypothetical protein